MFTLHALIQKFKFSIIFSIFVLFTTSSLYSQCDGGNASMDDCGICDGGNASYDCNEDCSGSLSAGTWVNTNPAGQVDPSAPTTVFGSAVDTSWNLSPCVWLDSPSTIDNGDGTVTIFATLHTTGLPQLARLLQRLETIGAISSVKRFIGS